MKYLCRTADDHDEYAKPYEKNSPEDAACEFARDNDSRACEYPDEQEVVVICPDGNRLTLTVLAASVREYWVPRKRARA